MKPLRILHTEPSTGLSGQEIRILSEAVGMAKRGHTVILVVPPNSKLKECAERERLGVEPVSQKLSRFVSLIFEFLFLIRKHRIQILNTHGSVDSWTASIAGRLSSQKPIIIRSRHNSTPFSKNLRHKILYQMLPHVIVTTGIAVRKLFIQGYGLDETRVVSIPTGVDLGIFRTPLPSKTIKADLGLSTQDFIVGTVGFIRYEKGLNYFVDAAGLVLQRHPEVKFLLVGEGPEEENLNRKIEDMGLAKSIVLTGFRKDIPELLATMNVFVLSSIEEGLPQTLTQAMAMQRPVVATDVGSVGEVVKHGTTGLLVPPRNFKALAESITVLIQDQALREALGRAGRDLIVKSYSMESMLDQTEDLYTRLLQTSSSLIPP